MVEEEDYSAFNVYKRKYTNKTLSLLIHLWTGTAHFFIYTFN